MSTSSASLTSKCSDSGTITFPGIPDQVFLLAAAKF